MASCRLIHTNYFPLLQNKLKVIEQKVLKCRFTSSFGSGASVWPSRELALWQLARSSLVSKNLARSSGVEPLHFSRILLSAPSPISRYSVLFESACNNPMVPHAFPIVCLMKNTCGSTNCPLLEMIVSSSLRKSSYLIIEIYLYTGLILGRA